MGRDGGLVVGGGGGHDLVGSMRRQLLTVNSDDGQRTNEHDGEVLTMDTSYSGRSTVTAVAARSWGTGGARGPGPRHHD
jgi:hypothetical protein